MNNEGDNNDVNNDINNDIKSFVNNVYSVNRCTEYTPTLNIFSNISIKMINFHSFHWNNILNVNKSVITSILSILIN